MADLSQYIDFTVKIDNSGTSPRLSLTDISEYPVGASAFQGFIKVTQPDGISVGPDFSTPDVTDAVRTGSKPYRLSSDGSLQNGTYVIQYAVQCVGYDDTVVTRTFSLGYVRPKLNLVPSIDAFTPAIKVADNSDFFQMGLVILTISRLWSGSIFNVGASKQTISGTAQVLDFAYNSNYYDAMYYASLTDTISYQLAQFAWVSVTEKLTNQIQFDVYTPLTVAQFKKAIYEMEANYKDTCGNCEGSDSPDVIKANNLLANIILLGEQGDTIGLQVYTDKLYNLLYPNKAQTHTNQSIPSYIFSDSPAVPLVTLPQNLVASLTVGGIPAGLDLSNSNILDAFAQLITGGSSGGVATAWWGWGLNQNTPADPSTLQKSGTFASSGSLLADFSDNTANNNYLKIATLATVKDFTTWEYNGMSGGIDTLPNGSNLFYKVEVNGLKYYITNYPTIVGQLLLN